MWKPGDDLTGLWVLLAQLSPDCSSPAHHDLDLVCNDSGKDRDDSVRRQLGTCPVKFFRIQGILVEVDAAVSVDLKIHHADPMAILNAKGQCAAFVSTAVPTHASDAESSRLRFKPRWSPIRAAP